MDSAGTAAYHVGEAPDHRSIRVAKHHGIDISHQQARQFEVSDFDAFDFIYAMDTSNYTNIIGLARTNQDIGKVKLLLEANETISNKNVPDPFYVDFENFEHVFQLLSASCKKIASDLG